MAPERRAGRARGKSDPIDALAVARAALREPRLDHPRPGEEHLRELKLLVDHRDDLIDERRRAQQRLRWHLHDLDPTLAVPIGATGSTAAATASSTAPCTGSRSRKAASIRPRVPTSSASKARARADAKHSAASSANSLAPSTPPSKRSRY